MYFNFTNGYPPIQFFMAGRNNIYGNKRTKMDNFTAYYDMFVNFCDLFLNMFEWKGLPDTCNERMLETTLLFNGNCLFFQHTDNGGYFHCPFTFDSTDRDFYGNPTAYYTMSPTYNGKRYTDDNAVVIMATRMQYPLWIALELYARRVADTQRSIDVAQQTMKRPFVVLGNKDAKVTIDEIFHQQQANEIYMIKDKNTMKNTEFKLFTIPESSHNLMALWDNLNNLYTEVYKRIGIKSSAQDKAERLVVNEAKSQFQSVDANINIMLDCRKHAAELINEKFGLNITVDLRHEYDDDMTNSDFDNEGGNPNDKKTE